MEEKELEVWQRLERKGIDINKLKELISSLPSIFHPNILLAEKYGDKTIGQIKTMIQSWEDTVNTEFITPNEYRSKMKENINIFKIPFYFAIKENHFTLTGERIEFPPQISDDNILRLGFTNEFEYLDLEEYIAECKKILDSKINWEEIKKHKFGEKLVSKRRLIGWPVFSQKIFPELYDFLYPFYKKPALKLLPKQDRIERDADYPKELLQDMSDLIYCAFGYKCNEDDIKNLITRTKDRKEMKP